MLKKPAGRIGLFAGLVVIVLLYFLIAGSGGPGGDLPDYPVKYGNFRVTITETGELSAKNSVVVRAPSVRTNLQVLWLAEKGSHVEAGDTLVIFDQTEVLQRIEEAKNELEKSEASLDKSRSSMASTMADLEAGLQSAQASYRQAELRLEQMQFEAEVVKEEQELALQQSHISLEQAQKRIEQQKIINRAELRTLQLNVQQAEISLHEEEKALSELTMIAPQPGLVVYMKLWNGSQMAELRVGDTPWRRQALIELPDLSQMIVETAVNEVDVSRVKVGQIATIIPDAFPDSVYTGTVTDVAGLGRVDEESEANVKVFDVVIQLDEVGEVLKPGMTVSSTIIIKEVPDSYYIPLDAVFNHEGGSVVYRSSAGYKRTPVALGTRNDNFVVVTDGLDNKDRVSLVDPNTSFDPATWTGIDADEDSNSGSTAPTSMMNGGNGQ
ncbi:efflux RND transporter periplasmic adaptor subunit [bacterium]|nr:efflux RND transporter periplasmic adaptor subunit [bacterium]